MSRSEKPGQPPGWLGIEVAPVWDLDRSSHGCSYCRFRLLAWLGRSRMRKSSARAGNIARTSVRSRAVFFGASFFYLFTCEYSLSIVLCGLTSPLTTEHPEVVDTPFLLGESGWVKYACSCLAVLAFLLPVALSAQTAPAAKSWNLLWSDEFSGTALDASKWVYDIGGGKWGNQE